MLKDNLGIIKEKIDKASEKSPQRNNDVTLVAVSKTFPADSVKDAYDAGQRVFGENKVQEALDKINELKSLQDARYHMIGHLQRNKVKYISGVFELIHSVDRPELVKEMQKIFSREDVTQNILVQVNFAGEEQRSGVHPDKVYDLLDLIIRSENLVLSGFMLMPPFAEYPEDNRHFFAGMYELYEYYRNQLEKSGIHSFNTLSMGMSADYEVAVEEGSNMVRVGSAIFGNRNYK